MFKIMKNVIIGTAMLVGMMGVSNAQSLRDQQLTQMQSTQAAIVYLAGIRSAINICGYDYDDGDIALVIVGYLNDNPDQTFGELVFVSNLIRDELEAGLAAGKIDKTSFCARMKP